MTIGEMTALSLALGADLFSVAVPLGMAHLSLRTVVRLSAVFALLHMLLLALGASAGTYLAGTLERLGRGGDTALIMAENWAGLFGGAVLFLLGLYLLRESRRGEERGRMLVPHGSALLLLGISVSCDALAVGLGMGLIESGWLRLTSVLGIVIFAVSAVGLLLGSRIGRVLPRYAQPLGAAALSLWGLHAIWEALG